MSDFDKEAERQRLREKYERDETKRRSTQRMSELLLKGATMTNKHCDNCGDPLFRYEDQVFCPTCQAGGGAAANADQDAERAAEAAVEADAGEGGVDAEAETAPSGAAEAAESADADASAGVTAEAPEAERPQVGARQSEPGRGTRVADEARRDAAGTNGRAASPTPARTASERGSERRASRDVAGDVTDARESLVRTLTWAAERAESTDDPRRATEYLTAAREAAEAISALDR
ncbi:Sjogren's syndrome/scleroderma autoantigen 1 family protein [Haloferax sp. KTX1]|uniref:Sjogren's syndrome/scleroderma autoantigen 1 family protein n=1 Tax=Haloferax sp. KTX1 TaxID=2600597 RepID=UPI0011DD8719|nr:Sjogren's syndrome/scleroderma autoantigen 1 family protein [Haloferax sp. KTX1]